MIGTIFRLNNDLSLEKMAEGISIPNGITWSKDNKHLYLADSPSRNIYVYDFDKITGNISNRRIFFHVEDERGEPDGEALDADGNLWTAIYGTGMVLKISPDGQVLASIKIPTRCITCPVFVDEWLYVTSAAEEDPERYPESVKFQGGLFRCKVGVRGYKINHFKPLRTLVVDSN